MSIGKAGKAMTKQIGKTLTSLGESPDKRGHQRMFLANNPQVNALLGDHKPKGQRIPTKGASDLGLGKGTSSFILSHFPRAIVYEFSFQKRIDVLQETMKLVARRIELTLLLSFRVIAPRTRLSLTALASDSY
jgi:hypothetical protein